MADSFKRDSKMRKKLKPLFKLLWNGEKKRINEREQKHLTRAQKVSYLTCKYFDFSLQKTGKTGLSTAL